MMNGAESIRFVEALIQTPIQASPQASPESPTNEAIRTESQGDHLNCGTRSLELERWSIYVTRTGKFPPRGAPHGLDFG